MEVGKEDSRVVNGAIAKSLGLEGRKRERPAGRSHLDLTRVVRLHIQYRWAVETHRDSVLVHLRSNSLECQIARRPERSRCDRDGGYYPRLQFTQTPHSPWGDGLHNPEGQAVQWPHPVQVPKNCLIARDLEIATKLVRHAFLVQRRSRLARLYVAKRH